MGLVAGVVIIGRFLPRPPNPSSSLHTVPEQRRVLLAIHGGAGRILRNRLTEERERGVRDALRDSLAAGYLVLRNGGSSLDCVVAAVQVMEDSPMFNAGKGAVFNSDGIVELDASIMDGRTRNAGAVAGVRRIRNPTALARLVMEESPHVMMAGEGAEAFAAAQDIDFVENSYFLTERRPKQLEQRDRSKSLKKFGTVGAVAVDTEGNLAAATSTGGMTNKKFGRVGDSPIIGAGTYADNTTCAVSSTGHGEFFIRGVVAYDVAAMMDYSKKSLRDAARTVVMEKLTNLGGAGGIIALDRQGNVSMPFNTSGMYRGVITNEGEITIKIFPDLA